MARLAVLASGNGGNFQALAEALRGTRHECVLLGHDRRAAFAAERARHLGVPAAYVGYAGRAREEAEAELLERLRASGADIVALAGFLRLLSPAFVGAWTGRLVNIHPSLLPAWPGLDSVRRAYEAGERRFGVTAHFVDEGMDTGPVIDQAEFEAREGESLESVEARIHELEHRLFPRAVLGLLDRIEEGRSRP